MSEEKVKELYDFIDKLPILEHGSEGLYVKLLQILLYYYGYNIEEDGEFGILTNHFVVQYQKTHGLDVTGVVDSKTWASLLMI